MTEHKTAEVQMHGNSWLVALTVGTSAIQVQGHETWRLSDASGAFVLTLPKQMIPFAQAGDHIVMVGGFVKGTVSAVSSIIRPGNGDAKAN